MQESLGTWKGWWFEMKWALFARQRLPFYRELLVWLIELFTKPLLNQKSQMTKFINSLYVSENVTDVSMVGVLRGPQVKSCGAKTVSWASFSLIKIGNSYVIGDLFPSGMLGLHLSRFPLCY